LQNAHDVIREKLDSLRNIPGVNQAILDQIETLTSPYMVPVQGEEWIKYRLTTQEVRVACLLHTRLGKLVTRSGLMDAMWFDDPDGGKTPKNLDVVLCRVRQKIGSVYTIENIAGRGYIMHRVGEAEVQAVAA
jgi:DNA-binding response OmpR family regulator